MGRLRGDCKIKRIYSAFVFISVLLIFYFITVDTAASYDPEPLLPILNTIFIGALPVSASFFSAKIYIKSNVKSALYMCCGMLVFGIGSTAAGWLRFLPDGANATVTVHNIAALAGSLFHFIAAFREEAVQSNPDTPGKRKTRTAALVCELSVFITLLIFAVLIKALPPFVAADGFSMLRQFVLWSSVVFFFAASMLFWKMYQRKKTGYFFWYSASLALITVGLAAVCVQQSVGSPMGWLGRIDQYIGGLFAVFSVRAAIKEAEKVGSDLPSFARDFFSNAEEIYTSLVEKSANAIIIVDRYSRIMFANQAAAVLLGYKKRELAGLSFFALIGPAQRELIRSNFEILMSAGNGASHGKPTQADAIRKNGELFPVELSCCIHRSAGQNICAFSIQDATNRRNAEEALAKSENLLKTIIEETPDLMYLKDTNGRIVLCNKACAVSLGRTVEETIGLDDFSAYDDPNLARVIFENDQKIIRENKSQVLEEIAPNGRIYLSTKTPWKDAQGRVIGIIGVSQDITDRRKEQEELFRLKNELSAEVRSLNVLYRVNSNFIIQNDMEKIIRKVLGAAVLLTESEKGSLQLIDEKQTVLTMIATQGLGEGFIQQFHKIDLHTGTCGQAIKERKMVLQAIRGNPLFEGKRSLEFLLEEGIQTELSMPLITSSGKFVGVINIYDCGRSKTGERERRMLEMLARIAADKIQEHKMRRDLQKSQEHALALVEELRAADRNKNEFLNHLSHELRNPLAVIVAGLSLLESTDDSHKTEPAKQIMRRQTDQLCSLVDDLLDLTRITNNKIVLKKERLELNTIVLQTAEEHKTLFIEKNMQLETAAHGKEIFLYADPVRLKQIIGNLLNNAIKFSDAHSKTSIRMYETDKDAVIQIKDNGIGIEPAFIPDLFEPFKQAGNLTERTSGGLGLGLAVVKGIVELHGGNITAQSEGPGKGSVFTICLPKEKSV